MLFTGFGFTRIKNQSIYLTESLSNVRSSTFEGTFSVFSGKWSIFIRFSLCDLSLGAPFPGLQKKKIYTFIFQRSSVYLPQYDSQD